MFTVKSNLFPVAGAAIFALMANFVQADDARLKKGDCILDLNFKGIDVSELKKDWSPEGAVEFGAKLDDGSLLFDVPASSKPEGIKISRSLDVDKIRGATLNISTRIRGEDISPKPKPYNGGKIMLKVVTESESIYPQARPIKDGTFGWTDASIAVAIPESVKSVTLTIGLEKVSGKIWFENVKVQVVETPANIAATVPREGPVFKGHPLPRLRGAMVRTETSEEDLKILGGKWNANLIRWQLGALKYKTTGLNTPDFDKILDDEIARLDALLPVCRKYGMYVVVDMHSLAMETFSSTANQDKLVEVWKKLAAHYKGNPVVWGYDIVNEPRLSNWKEGTLLWNDLAERVSKEIRKVDPDTPIIIEPEMLGVPAGFETLRPVSVPNVIYSVHMYNPGQFTHNRVYDPKQPSYTYPGMIDGKMWDKAELERNLKPVIDFQKKYGVHIYVGEFSAIRWSPGADKYLSDLIDIFEKYDWDWSYHAFREFHGWSLEHGSDINDKNPSATQTDREKIVRSWLDKNKKPDWTGK
ncbi:MAG TPA: hypothetical protein DCZ94_17110 [Lentisphaeria bacterium]|nr:MAG: hypothetical protein A2X48_21070 [Lentisphaerae bacterium GWF2_49_21]HBC88666.1 hypothetical protein [Lentisphaeria bacterium]